MKSTRFLAGAALILALSSCGSPSPTAVDIVTSLAPAVGDTFTDPEGAYTMTVGRDWTKTVGAGDVEGLGKVLADYAEYWLIPAPSSGFATSLNVVTLPPLGIELADFVAGSGRAVENMDGDLKAVQTTMVEGANGSQMGYVEYSGVATGREADGPLHYLVMISLRDHGMAVVTLQADEASFEQQRRAAMPYMLTLQAT